LHPVVITKITINLWRTPEKLKLRQKVKIENKPGAWLKDKCFDLPNFSHEVKGTTWDT
jgi:hypothetical protein